jgi:hypothetical protein
MGKDRGVYRVLVGKPEGKRPLGRPRHRWEDNIKMGLQEVGVGRGDWMELAQDRDRDSSCGYGEVLSGSINAGNFLTSGKVYWLASQEGHCSTEYGCSTHSRAIFSLIIRSVYTVLQLLVLHTYVAAGWYHGSVGTATAVPTLP